MSIYLQNPTPSCVDTRLDIVPLEPVYRHSPIYSPTKTLSGTHRDHPKPHPTSLHVQIIFKRNARPPEVFKRLNEFIQRNGLRAHEVYSALDTNQNKRLSLKELQSGLAYVGFSTSEQESQSLTQWMKALEKEEEEEEHLTFKEFALALKQRVVNSPPRRHHDSTSSSLKSGDFSQEEKS